MAAPPPHPPSPTRGVGGGLEKSKEIARGGGPGKFWFVKGEATGFFMFRWCVCVLYPLCLPCSGKVRIKTKNLPRTTRFGLCSFYRGFLKDDHLSKMTTLEWFQERSSYTVLTVIIKLAAVLKLSA